MSGPYCCAHGLLSTPQAVHSHNVTVCHISVLHAQLKKRTEVYTCKTDLVLVRMSGNNSHIPTPAAPQFGRVLAGIAFVLTGT